MRDNTEKWWNSFDQFFSKAVMETDTCGFNSRPIYFNLIKIGMFGPAMKRMVELGKQSKLEVIPSKFDEIVNVFILQIAFIFEIGYIRFVEVLKPFKRHQMITALCSLAYNLCDEVFVA